MNNFTIKKVRPNNKRKSRFQVRYEDDSIYPMVVRTFRTEAKAKTFVVRLIFALQGENPAYGYLNRYIVKEIAQGIV